MSTETKQTEETNMFTQLCVWPGTIVGKERIEKFVEFMQNEFDSRVKYETEVETLPDLDNFGQPVPDTGGRIDLFFYVHSDDITKFATKKLKYGIRWWEDVIKYNDNSHLYTKEFIKRYPTTW